MDEAERGDVRVVLLFWMRLPVVVRAVLAGSVVGAAGTAPWAVLVSVNSKHGSAVPPIERRHGPVVAILVTGSLFGFAHFTHPEVTVILMPYYLAAAAIYGALAYLTDSILPSVVLHAGGNVLSAIGLIAGGRLEWQESSSPAPLICETGADASFWISCLAALIVGAAAVWAYAALANVARKVSQPA
jgi:hypothetical protein